MQAIPYLIDCIKREIPPQLLAYTLTPPTMLGRLTPSLDHMIASKIIQDWLLKDCDIIGGREVNIDLASCIQRNVEGGLIVEVPAGALAGQTITSVLSVGLGYANNAGSSGTAGAIVSVLTPTGSAITYRVQVVGPNTVFLEGGNLVGPAFMRCIISNSNDFSNIAQRALLLLGDMAVQAAKAYIYTNRVIEVQEAAIRAGVELSVYSSLIDGYSDAHTIYKELRNTRWRKVALMQDPTTQSRMIRAMIPR